MKALNNFCAAAGYAALAEALVLGREFGLVPATMVEIVNNSTGRSFLSDVVFPDEVLTGRYGTGFTAGLLAKDVAIAACGSLARSQGMVGRRPVRRHADVSVVGFGQRPALRSASIAAAVLAPRVAAPVGARSRARPIR